MAINGSRGLGISRFVFFTLISRYNGLLAEQYLGEGADRYPSQAAVGPIWNRMIFIAYALEPFVQTIVPGITGDHSK